MAPRKSERILNLTICLLSARRFVSKARIREAVEGYAGLSDSAFERQFERDKDELRAMGVPVETGGNSVFFDDELGYRISRDDFELPPVEFSAAEAAVVALGAQSWRQSGLAASSRRAVTKLRAGGMSAAEPLAGLTPTLDATEPSFEPLWDAVLTRSRVRFGYRGQTRTLDPWIITSAKGRWYVAGLDLERGEPRIFRLSRIEGEPSVVAGPGAFAVPDDIDARQVARSLEPPQGHVEALLAIKENAAPALRRRGEPADRPGGGGADGPAGPPGFGIYRVRYGEAAGFAGEVAAFGADVVVLAPPELREATVAHLRAVLEGAA